MSNPTTPFGWQMPENTDLVTDLPADFEVFGQAVATDLQYLLGGTTGQVLAKASATDLDFDWIANDVGDITAVTAGTGISGGGTSGAVTITNSMATAIDAKGDLVAGTGADAFSRLAVGTNGQVLTANSAAATGLEYTTLSSGGGMTLLETLTLSGGSVVSSAISQSYINLEISVVGFRPANNDRNLFIRINGLSSASYSNTQVGAQVYNGTFTETEWVGSLQNNSGVSNGLSNFTIPDYTNSTSWKWAMMNSISNFEGNIANVCFQTYRCITNIQAAVSTLTFFTTGNMTSGTVYIYGVK